MTKFFDIETHETTPDDTDLDAGGTPNNTEDDGVIYTDEELIQHFNALFDTDLDYLRTDLDDFEKKSKKV